MNVIRKAEKELRYAEKKNAWECMVKDVKTLLGISDDAMESIDERYERKSLRIQIACLIGELLYESNTYETKTEISEIKLSKELFEKYNVDINSLTNNEQDIDLLCKVLRAI